MFEKINDSMLLQEDLDSLQNWSAEWKLNFKEAKCSLVRISKCPAYTTEYNINGTPVAAECKHRDLGVIITSNQSWSDHIDSIVKRAYMVLGILRRTFSSVDGVEEKRTLYLTLVRSQLMYSSLIWRPCRHHQAGASSETGVQRLATKFILNDYQTDYKQRLISLNMLPLMYELEVNDILFCVKSLKIHQNTSR